MTHCVKKDAVDAVKVYVSLKAIRPVRGRPGPMSDTANVLYQIKTQKHPMQSHPKATSDLLALSGFGLKDSKLVIHYI